MPIAPGTPAIIDHIVRATDRVLEPGDDGPDIVIRGGRVIDGRGTPAFAADVAIRDGRIEAVSDPGRLVGQVILEAEGSVVAPGFIDAHDHGDLMLLADPQHAAKLAQGVTTEVMAQDGLSYAPLGPANLAHFRTYLAGAYGNPTIERSWRTMGEFRALFDESVAVNTVFLVPHGAIRAETAGLCDVPMSADHLRRARRLIDEAMDEGAVGLSTGLSYFPGSYGDTQEISRLCETVAARGGVYVTHTRTVFPNGRFDPVEEALEIGRRAEIPVHISHYRTNARSAGRIEDLMAPIDAAVADGQDVSVDTYPYAYGAGFALAILPAWVHAGSLEEIRARLVDPASRARMREDFHALADEDPTFFSDRFLSHLPSARNRPLIGRTLTEAMRLRGATSIVDILCDLLLDEDFEVGANNVPPDDAVSAQIEQDVFSMFERPFVMAGSDSIYVGERHHPRSHGTFPRLLGRLRRQIGTLSLETLVNRVTAAPAARFGLSDRGIVAPGYAADIVVFDEASLVDTATWEHPSRLAQGVAHVMVNGAIALKDGLPTGVLAGRSLP
jgi:N-acyl-D-amino-acid deacylase